MAKTKEAKKISTVGVKDPAVRRVIEELAARVVALENAMAEKAG